MSDTSWIGMTAEAQVAEYLQNKDYEIINRNWKTRWCEIDIVAKKTKRIYFVEVKYRKNVMHGSGIEYITAAKTKQLRLAARFWVYENNWEGDYQIDVASV